MKIRGGIRINGQQYEAGAEIPWYRVYPFFLVHMLMFGGSGFLMAYSASPAPLFFIYLHGGFAILVYTLFYLTIFGLDEVKWMFINAGLGLVAIYTQVAWLLSLFGKRIEDYPASSHVIPFLYYVLYTFLLRNALLDIFGARDDEGRRLLVDRGYVALSLLLSAASFFLGK